MAADVSWIRQEQATAWAFGRTLRDNLLDAYRRQYGLTAAPPPAKIIDELLTDFLHVELRHEPLPLDRFAETRWGDERAVVTINSRTREIPGVRHPEGVENVGKWHEAVHVARDLDVLRRERPPGLPGFDAATAIVCLRSGKRSLFQADKAREFWAEEASRAATVSMSALRQSEAFRRLSHMAPRSLGPAPEAWPLLYQAAEDIGVNISALVKQLTLESWIVVVREGGRERVYIQPALAELLEAS
jgi:hypothetical protein